MRALLAVGLVLTLAACSSSSASPAPPSGSGQDAGEGDAGEAPVGDGDAGGDAADALSPTKTTSANVTLGGVSRTLERAQFGVTKKDDTLYVEAYEGGVQACPETETPKRTLIVSGVPKGAPGTSFTMKDGVTVSLVDFSGDQIPTTPPNAKATAATVTIVALETEKSVELAIDATFANGSAKGRVYATYCAAMSE